MISVIVTSFNEPRTIGKAIEKIVENNLKDYELLVVAPDKETLDVAKEYSQDNKRIKVIKDERRGKPAALNLAVSKAKGDILILTDGDVYVGENSLAGLIKPLDNKKIGAVSGRPVSLNSKNTMLGYWAYLLTSVANQRRINALKNKKNFFCSGYLFSIRKNLYKKLPENILSEDGYLSNKVYEDGYKLGYSKNSKVYVRYPTKFSDWIIQKRRSAGGYNQIKKLTGKEMRSFKKEALGGFGLLRYIGGIKEFYWFIRLLFARIYLWIVIYRDINIKNKTHKEIWKPVKSTK